MFPRLAMCCLAAGVVGAPLGAQAAPGLRVLPLPPDWSGERTKLMVGSADARPLDAERGSRIEVLATTDLGLPLARWPVVDGTRTLSNGLLHWHAPLAPATERRFFAAREASVVDVTSAAGLRAAVAAAKPGTRIQLAPGKYAGGFFFDGPRGEPGLPIVLTAADPTAPPVIEGGTEGMHFSRPVHLELRQLVLTGATGNGLNIDDGGNPATPAHHVTLRGLRVVDVGPSGNRDGIKLSGLDDFLVEGCTVERWGSGGSAIDMVGCHAGLIVDNVFRHTAAVAAENGSGVQAKGGSRDIVVRRNRFEYAGSRAVNIGGSTGLEFFRPPLVSGAEHWEAKDIRVEGNTFLGSSSPVAFVGVDGAAVRFNTIYRPQRWAVRILQENTAAGFVACRNGVFTDNLVAFHSSQWSAGGVNLGGNTAPATFRFARNWWYCLDAPNRSRPTLPVAETGGTYGVSPQFRDADAGDFRLLPGSPAGAVGAEAFVE